MRLYPSNESIALLDSTNSSFFFDNKCIFSGAPLYIYSSLAVINVIVLLPLCIYILISISSISSCVRKWRQKHSFAATMSHSDCFLYHMVIMEIIGVMRWSLNFAALITSSAIFLRRAKVLFYFTYYGEIYFHLLTCVERYLAVVYPIIYRSLRNQRGVRIRNISIACVWLLCLAGTMLMVNKNRGSYLESIILTITLIIICFCSLSVLRVLIRQPPGDQVGTKERVDESKQKAFFTMLAILGVVLVRFLGGVYWLYIKMTEHGINCYMESTEVVFNLPSSLVLPLLFLQRKGKYLQKRIFKMKKIKKGTS